MKSIKLTLGDETASVELDAMLSDENHARLIRHAKAKYPHVWDMDGSITGEVGQAIEATEEESVTMLLNKVIGLIAVEVQEGEAAEKVREVKPVDVHPEPRRPGAGLGRPDPLREDKRTRKDV